MPPILSICIPTHNRKKLLHRTLESISEQPIFANTLDVEVVVSDNASSDGTEEIVNEYLKKFPNKIKYFRNKKNLNDVNFTLALGHGSGSYLKLHNDTLLFQKDSLTEILEILRNHTTDRIVPFFLNGCIPSKQNLFTCSNFDQFVLNASFYSTWIGAFSISREDFLQLEDVNRAASLQLIQTELLIRVLTKINAPKALIINKQFFSSQSTEKKGGYNVAQVFGQNYLRILKRPLTNGLLTKKTYEIEKRKLLKKHIIPWYFDVNKNHNFNKNGFFCFMGEYKFSPYFYIFLSLFLIRNSKRFLLSTNR